MKKPLLRRVLNRILHIIARFSPGAENFRPFLHRLRGVKIYGRVFIGDDVYIENECPECVEIHDEAQIAIRTIIIAHFRGNGKIIIEKKVWIGPNCVITANPGQTLTIGEGSVVAASSVVTRDVPTYTFVGRSSAKPIAKVTVPMILGTSFQKFKNGLRPLDKKKIC